jgi:hypothetical protein
MDYAYQIHIDTDTVFAELWLCRVHGQDVMGFGTAAPFLGDHHTGRGPLGDGQKRNDTAG